MKITNTFTGSGNRQSLPVTQTAKKTTCFSEALGSVHKIGSDSIDLSSKARSAMSGTRLSDSAISDLTADFDPQHMSGTQYNDFLNSLVQKGVLTEKEKYWAGYDGCQVDAPGVSDVPVTYSRSLEEARGNALDFARGMSAVRCYPSSAGSNSPMNSVIGVFKRIDSVLEQMLLSDSH